MTPQKIDKAIEMLTELRADITTDVVRRDGQPFTGYEVGTALGEIAAQLDAVAHVVLEMLPELKLLMTKET